jgi:hypothetical protein
VQGPEFKTLVLYKKTKGFIYIYMYFFLNEEGARHNKETDSFLTHLVSIFEDQKGTSSDHQKWKWESHGKMVVIMRF